MASTGDDWQFWKWVFGIAGGAIAGLIGGAWTGRGVLAELHQTDHSLDMRVAVLEQNHAQCREDFREEINIAIQSVINHLELQNAAKSLQYAEQLGEIKTNLAVIIALSGETKKDIEEIFTRLNRRTHDEPVGDERRA